MTQSPSNRRHYPFFMSLVGLLIGLLLYLIWVEGRKYVAQSHQKEPLTTAQHTNSSTRIAHIRTVAIGAEAQEQKNQIEALAQAFPDHLLLEGLRISDKRIALTFDEAPDMRYMPEILTILRRYEVRATFFMVGYKMLRDPEMVREAVIDGHQLGNHTFNHPELLPEALEELYQNQVLRSEQVFEDLISIQPRLLRVPYGKITAEQLAFLSQRGYYLIHWSIDTYPWTHPSQPQLNQPLAAQLMPYVHPGAIIRLYTGGEEGEKIVQALPAILEELQREGYQFETVASLVGIPANF
jgi:peptidoglycan/xylan/chitin deacetylase (PgdA/CDA1 family)